MAQMILTTFVPVAEFDAAEWPSNVVIKDPVETSANFQTIPVEEVVRFGEIVAGDDRLNTDHFWTITVRQ